MTGLRDAQTQQQMHQQGQVAAHRVKYTLLGMAVVFLAVPTIIISCNQYLINVGKQQFWWDHVLSLSLLYGHFRVYIQEYVFSQLTTSSSIFKSFPDSYARDTAFFLVDFFTILFVLPLAMYPIYEVFRLQNMDQFYHLHGSYLKTSIMAYQVDRLLHLAYGFGRQRMMHHFMELILLLLNFDLLNPDQSAPVIMMGFAFLEGGFKVVWGWLFMVRMARSLAKKRRLSILPKDESDHTGTIINGIYLGDLDSVDTVFIGWMKDSEKCIHVGKFCFFFLLFIFSVTGAIIFAAIQVFPETLLVWKILGPIFWAAFFMLDLEFIKLFHRFSTKEYWTTTIFGPPTDRSTRQMPLSPLSFISSVRLYSLTTSSSSGSSIPRDEVEPVSNPHPYPLRSDALQKREACPEGENLDVDGDIENVLSEESPDPQTRKLECMVRFTSPHDIVDEIKASS